MREKSGVTPGEATWVGIVLLWLVVASLRGLGWLDWPWYLVMMPPLLLFGLVLGLAFVLALCWAVLDPVFRTVQRWWPKRSEVEP